MSGIPFAWTGDRAASTVVLLAHGAGAPMTSPFLELMAALLAGRGLLVARFEFAYMAARRRDGKRRPPPKAELLLDEYRTAVAEVRSHVGDAHLVVGGKSLGGRVASLVADELHAAGLVAGLVCLGYPFHPPGKPEALRTAHLEALACPALVVQGERDPFGARTEVEDLRLAPAIRWVWMADGDHDFGPRGGSGTTRRANMIAAADAVADFAQTTTAGRR